MVVKVEIGKRYLYQGKPVRITSIRLIGTNPSIWSGYWADNGRAVFCDELSEIEYDEPIDKVG